MFTAYFYARRIQKIEEETRAHEKARQEHEKARQEAEAQLQTLKAQLERSIAPRRRRRSLR